MDEAAGWERDLEEGPAAATYPWPVSAWPTEWGGTIRSTDAPDELWASVRWTPFPSPPHTTPRDPSRPYWGWLPANNEWSIQS